MSKKIIYISTFIPRNIKDRIASSLKNFNFNSADAFSYAIFDGLYRNLGSNFQCINIAPVGAFPRFNKSPYFKENITLDNGVKVESVGFSTLYAYMYVSIYKNLYSYLVRNVNPNDDNIFLIYSINMPVINAIIKYRRTLSRNSKIILIIPDQIEDFSYNTIPAKIKLKISGNVQEKYDAMDGFVLLTEHMIERIRVKKTFCVVEGIYNSSENRPLPVLDKSEIQTLFYSGMLYEKFGVKDMIEAFMRIENPNLRLNICGTGELVDYIKTISKIDKRINYLGLIDRARALSFQSQSSLLINPRKPIQEFTKYSFPSKNIEYMVSGVPTLLYELPGIPQEYYSYCFHIAPDQLDIGYLSSKIECILNLPSEELMRIGTKASMFIKDNKNSKVQVKKILNLIESIS